MREGEREERRRGVGREGEREGEREEGWEGRRGEAKRGGSEREMSLSAKGTVSTCRDEVGRV